MERFTTHEQLEEKIQILTQELVELMAENQSRDKLIDFNIFIEEMPAIAHSIDNTGVIVNVSNLWLSKMGYAREEVVGSKSIEFLTSESQRDAVEKYLPQFIKQGYIENVQYEFIKKNGEIVYALLSAIGKYDEQGELLHTLAVLTDISDRVKAERELKKSEEKYRTLVQLAQEGIWVIDREGKTTFVNPSMCKILGYNETEMLGKHLFTFMDEEGKAIAEKNLKRRESGIDEQHDFEFINKEGTKVYTTIETAPILDKNGDYDGAIAGVVNITERKKVEFELRLIRDALENSLNAFDIVDENGKIVFVNQAYIDMWGYNSKEEVLGESPTSYCKDAKVPQALINTLKKEGKAVTEFTARKKDGTFFEVLMYARLAYDETGREIYPTTSIDITTKKRLETALKEREEQLRTITETATDAIISTDSHGKIILWNKMASKLFSYSADEAIGRPLSIIMPQELKDLHETAFNRVLHSGELKLLGNSYESIGVDKSGKQFPVEISIARWTQYGELHFTGIVRDITARKEIEKKREAVVKAKTSLESCDEIFRQGESLGETMSQFLSQLLTIFSSDRAWLLYPCDPEAESWSVPYEQTTTGYPGAFEIGLQYPMNNESVFVMNSALSSNDPIIFGPGGEFPLPYEVAEKFQIQSLILVTIQTKTGAPWMLGMHQCSHQRLWLEEEIQLFGEVAKRLTHSLSSFLFMKELQSSERRFRTIVSSIPGITYRCLCDSDWTIDFISEEIEKISGYPASDFCSGKRTYASIIHPEDRQGVEDEVLARVAEKEPYALEYRIINRDEEIRWIYERGRATYDENDNVLWLDGVNLDYTEHKLALEEIAENRKQISLLINSTAEGIYGIDTDGKCTLWNPACAALLGYDEDYDFLGRNMHKLMHHSFEGGEVYEEKDCKVYKSFFENKKVYVDDEVFWRRDGSFFPVAYWASPIIDGGRVMGAVVTFLDISERKKAQRALQESEEFLNKVGRIAQIGGWEMDMVTRKAKWTKGTYDIVEIDYNQPIPGPDEHIRYYLEEYQQVVTDAIQALVEENIPLDFEAKFRTAKGNIKWCRALGMASYDKGELVKLSGTFQDITAVKEVAIKLEEYAERQEILLREVNHRVKNNLSIIISMLHREKDRAKHDGKAEGYLNILDDILHRIEGLLVVHNLLSTQNWGPLNISYFCEQVTKGFVASVQGLAECEVNYVNSKIDSNQAQNLAIIRFNSECSKYL